MSLTVTDGGYPKIPRARKLVPRRRLPSGRAVVGALLVTVAAVAAFALAGRDDSGPGTAYLVANRPLPEGMPVEIEDVSFQPMTLPAAVASNAVSSAVGVEGATATRDLAAGEIISVRDLIAAPTVDDLRLGAVHEISLPVAGDRISSRVVPGDRVTVLSTLRRNDEPTTVVAAEDALVMEWSRDGGASGSGVLTLALEDAITVMGVTHLTRLGDVTVVRTTRSTSHVYPAYFSTTDLPATNLPAADLPATNPEPEQSDDR